MLAAARHGVPLVDLTGFLLDHLGALTCRGPVGTPGLYREQRAAYFERVEATELSVADEDGRRPEGSNRVVPYISSYLRLADSRGGGGGARGLRPPHGRYRAQARILHLELAEEARVHR